MKQNYIRNVAAIAALAIAGSTFAARVDFGEVEMGKTYEFVTGSEIYATYTAPADGIYKFVYYNFELPWFTDQTYTTPVEHTHFYGADNSRNWSIPMTAGQTIYCYCSSTATFSDGSMTLATPPESLELASVSPGLEPGSAEYYGGELSASEHYRMTFFFSEQVTCTSASLRFPDGSYSPCATQIVGSSIQVGFSTQIMEAYREGKLKKGDTAKIRLVGVRCVDYPDIRYGTNGRLEVEFKVAAKPVELVKTVNAPTTGMDTFLSYYIPGDPNGILTMEFDGELSTTSQIPTTAMLVFGDPEDVEHPIYQENLPVKIEGNTLTIDLTGKLRRPVDMIPGIPAESQQPNIGLSIANIYSTDGQRVFTGSMASFAAFGYSYPIKSVSYTFATDYTPVRGTQVKKETPVEIWIMNGIRTSFDGVTISSVKDGQPIQMTLPGDDIEVSTDPYDEEAVLINFKMPDLQADENAEVIVTPADVFFADGVNHSQDVVGRYLWTNGSGVEGIEAVAETNADVYNLTGTLVLRDASREGLNRLPAGIYIYGKEKIAVK